MTMTAPDFLPRAPALPPGIGAHTVLEVLKTNAPFLYMQVCAFVSAHYTAAMSAQCRRAATQPTQTKEPPHEL